MIAAHRHMIVTLAFQGAAMDRAGHMPYPIYRNHAWQERRPAPSDSAYRFAMCIMALEAVYDRQSQENTQLHLNKSRAHSRRLSSAVGRRGR